MQLFHILLSAIAALFQRICPQVCHHLTKSSKSPASIAKNNKQWVGDLLVSGGVQAPPDKLRSSYLVMSRQRSGLRISARLRAGAHDGVWVFLCIFIYVL